MFVVTCCHDASPSPWSLYSAPHSARSPSLTEHSRNRNSRSQPGSNREADHTSSPLVAAYYNDLRTHRALTTMASISRAIKRVGAVHHEPVLGGLHGFGTEMIKPDYSFPLCGSRRTTRSNGAETRQEGCP